MLVDIIYDNANGVVKSTFVRRIAISSEVNISLLGSLDCMFCVNIFVGFTSTRV